MTNSDDEEFLRKAIWEANPYKRVAFQREHTQEEIHKRWATEKATDVSAPNGTLSAIAEYEALSKVESVRERIRLKVKPSDLSDCFLPADFS
jgi:hypothetical protein